LQNTAKHEYNQAEDPHLSLNGLDHPSDILQDSHDIPVVAMKIPEPSIYNLQNLTEVNSANQIPASPNPFQTTVKHPDEFVGNRNQSEEEECRNEITKIQLTLVNSLSQNLLQVP